MVPDTCDPGCRRKSEIHLAGFLAKSSANGPGTRAVIWVQGCPIRCPGCFNPQFWPFSKATVVSAGELARRIEVIRGIDGITFSGGEPFSQADSLAEVGEAVRKTGRTVVTYSGYSYRDLTESSDPAWKRLLSATDLLIAGPYVEELACNTLYIGSSNQEIIPLSGRIGPDVPLRYDCGETIEYSIAPDGVTTVTGFPRGCHVRGG